MYFEIPDQIRKIRLKVIYASEKIVIKENDYCYVDLKYNGR